MTQNHLAVSFPEAIFRLRFESGRLHAFEEESLSCYLVRISFSSFVRRNRYTWPLQAIHTSSPPPANSSNASGFSIEPTAWTGQRPGAFCPLGAAGTCPLDLFELDPKLSFDFSESSCITLPCPKGNLHNDTCEKRKKPGLMRLILINDSSQASKD